MCSVLYGVILIQILIKYNVKNLITAGTRLHDSDPKIEKSPYLSPLPHTPPARSPPPPSFEDLSTPLPANNHQ